MFKKFKDKLAEEMKQSPARLQASMQQLAQVVPGITNISTSELSTSNDNFSLTDGDDDTPRNTPDKYKLQAVDLTSYSSNSMGLSRTSSINSVTSTETSGLFPIYESPGSTYHLQSDMDQSASEVDEHVNPQFDQVSKEQIYAAYRKVQSKYHKYRGRYMDLANYYREMERAKSKLETLLVETQDKALRRIADLKEQCQLEQQAKAHLEEALRNDIEEKDHIIDTLNTKVKLLQANGTSTLIALQNQENLIDIVDNNSKATDDHTGSRENISNEQHLIPETVNSTLQLQLNEENQQLKNKLEKLENLILKYKESLKRSKEKISEITQDKLILERDLEMTKNSNHEQLQALTERLNEAKAEIIMSNEKINTMKRIEEESAISLAENKLSIHRELEIKEEQIKQLTLELKNAMQGRENAQMMADNNSELSEVTNKFTDGVSVKESDDIRAATDNAADSEKYLQQLETIKSLNEIIEAYVLEINEAEKKIQAQNIEMIQLSKESEDNYEKLRAEFENKCHDFLKIEKELMNCRVTVAQLNDELRDRTNVNDDLIREKKCLIENIVGCMKTVQSMKSNYNELRSLFKDNEIHVKQEFYHVAQSIGETIRQHQLHSLEMSSNDATKSYENEMKLKNTELMDMKDKLRDLETRNSKLIAELDNVNCKTFDIMKERDQAVDGVREMIEEKDLLNEKFQQIESKYLNQIQVIQSMENKIDTLQQTHAKQKEEINQYNEEKQYLSKNAEQVMILEENSKKLAEEMAEEREKLLNKITTIESENEIYKNNLTEHAIQLKNVMDKYKFTEEEYEELKSERNHIGMLLQEESEKSQSLILDNLKHSEEKSALSIKIRDLIDMVQAKNEFIEKLKLSKVRYIEEIDKKNSKIENLLALKETFENTKKSFEHERLQLIDNYSNRIEQLTNEITELQHSKMKMHSRINELEDLEERLVSSTKENNELKSDLDRQRKIIINLESQIQENNNSLKIMGDLQNHKEKSEIEIKQLKNQQNELFQANQELQDSKSLLEERLDELQHLSRVQTEEIARLKDEIGAKIVEIENMRKQVANNPEPGDNRLQYVVEELQSQLQEKESMFITSQATQTQIENLNDELRNEVEKLREQLSTFETEQTVRMQQLVKEFQARLQDKDKELQAALDQKFDWQKNYESELVQQYREQLKDFQHELTAKSEEIECLKVGKNFDSNKEMEKLVETIANIKLEHANEMKEANTKWRDALKQKCDQMEAKHNVVVNELTNEWKKNKFTDENVDQKPEELENMSAMAMAAVQSNTGSFHSLQQTLVSQRRELVELRKLVKIRHETLDDSTEIEYLRNILYEYMMGKETMVLARVIAAVVKFDQDQTNKILKKEEDKLTLLGSLGLT